MAGRKNNNYIDFTKNAEVHLQDSFHAQKLDAAAWMLRSNRDKSVKALPEWNELRDLASSIKNNVIDNLGDYLKQFEANAKENGFIIHWAKDAAEHNEIAYKLLKEKNIKRFIKSKSMLQEECETNAYLIERGIDPIESDLGERIQQLREERPGHIVIPSIHVPVEDVSELFHEKIGSEKGNLDPEYLVHSMRKSMRPYIKEAVAGMTGVNFGIAETGGIAIVTNEGNADLTLTIPNMLISSMGIEKIIPRQEDLGVFLRVLARSAVGYPLTSYNTLVHGSKSGGEHHIILVDNGRTDMLASEKYRSMLKCIRCGACMNTCPVYRRSGGLSYESPYEGPMGINLSVFRDIKKYRELVNACTFCGSCANVCPVQINLDDQIYQHRQDVYEAGLVPKEKKILIKLADTMLSKYGMYKSAAKMGGKVLPIIPKAVLYSKPNIWGKDHEMFTVAKESFADWHKKNRTNGK